MNKRLKGLMVVTAGAMALMLAPQANATVQITLTNGSSSVTVADGSAGDTCPAADCVTYNGPIGNYLINASTGISQSNNNPFLDLSSVNLALGAHAGLLTITTSNTGYTMTTPQFQFEVGGTSSLGGLVSFAAYGGNSNGIFDTSHQIGLISFPGSPFSGSVTSAGNTVNPYSLTIVASLNGGTAGSASFDAAINAVPEPASMALLGAVLLFTGSAIRRKLRRTA